jgi:DNA-directed RNA polymerase specialized sigma24 family protein
MSDWPELEALQPNLLRMLRSDEDALQELNLRLLQRRQFIQDLPRYARRAAGNSRRRPPKNHPLTIIDLDSASCPADPSSLPNEVAVDREQAGLLQNAISRLPPRQRQLIEARLAESTGPRTSVTCGSRSVRNSAVYKALRNLRKLLRSTSEEL